MHMYLTRCSQEMHMKSDVFGVSNTKRLRRTAVVLTDLPPHNLMMW